MYTTVTQLGSMHSPADTSGSLHLVEIEIETVPIQDLAVFRTPLILAVYEVFSNFCNSLFRREFFRAAFSKVQMGAE